MKDDERNNAVILRAFRERRRFDRLKAQSPPKGWWWSRKGARTKSAELKDLKYHVFL
jgi:hypothetical protein